VAGDRAGLRLRFALWRSGRGAVPAGFARVPEPRDIGAALRAEALVAGTFRIDREVVTLTHGQALWDAASGPDAQGFGWLADLAAQPNAAARALARQWTAAWLAHPATATGWRDEVAARRLTHLVRHAALLTEGPPDPLPRTAILSAIATHVRMLEPRLQTSPARLHIAVALVEAGTVLPDGSALARRAADVATVEVDRSIHRDGTLAARSPEHLLDLTGDALAVHACLTAAVLPVPPALIAAMTRAAPVLRALRHADGSLARFNGGASGVPGLADRILAATGVRVSGADRLAMGFARLSAGRTTVIADNAAPPEDGHAGTLAFELTSGRRPLVVNCGSGTAFGADWEQAGRATPSHSTLAVDGVSSSRLGTGPDAARLVQCARITAAHQLTEEGDHGCHAAHDGWAATHGLLHARTLILSADGRALYGEDRLSPGTHDQRKRLAAHIREHGPIAVSVRFHLHPHAVPHADGDDLLIALKSGEVWEFRHDSVARLTLGPSVYLDPARVHPQATQVITLAALLQDHTLRIGWTFAKAEDTPTVIRDLEP
jgi:uncharacterized heparinase superfamily protein